MTTEFWGSLHVLIIAGIGAMSWLNIFLMAKTFGWFTAKSEPVEVKVEATGAADNIWTDSAARVAANGAKDAATIAAKAQVEAARLQAQAAADNRAAEEARLKRLRLERSVGVSAGQSDQDGDNSRH